MGRLIDQGRRRHAQEAKQRRMKRILEAAAYMVQRLPYSQVTMDSISQRAKVKKGIASMYFGSKEKLFMELASHELDRWFDQLEQRFEVSGAASEPGDVSRVFAEQIAEGGVFPRLLSLLSTVLDHNLEVEAVVPFLRRLQAQMEEAGRNLASRCDRLSPEQGARLLRLLLTLMAGAHPFSNPIGVGLIAMADPSMAPLRVDLEKDLPELVAVFFDRA